MIISLFKKKHRLLLKPYVYCILIGGVTSFLVRWRWLCCTFLLSGDGVTNLLVAVAVQRRAARRILI